MNKIIQLFLEKSIKEIQENVLVCVKNGEGLSAIVNEVKKQTDNLGRQICVKIIESMDMEIMNDPKRKKDWHIERKNDIKSIITKLGEINYKRTYYCSKNKKSYKYLVDEIMDISVHERIDKEVRAELTETASDLSYRKSGKILSEAEISGQTVMKNVRSIEKLRLEKIVEHKKEVEILYVEADEDHISLQTGKKTITRLIYVHEGITTNSGRRTLKSPYYLSNVKGKSSELWQEVYEYIEDTYDTEKIKCIYLSGDGAAWIKQGLDFLPKAKFVLDKYHINKYVTKATTHMEEYATKIWDCLKEADLDELGIVMSDLTIATESESKREEIKDSYNYFKNNWAGIEIQETDLYNIVGCSAEGHISHILSARMSSRPMGWSKDGADKMARLRAFKANKGKVYDFLKAQKKEKKLYNVTKKLLKQSMQGLKMNTNEKIGNIEVFKYGKVTGVYNELKSII